LNGGGGWFVASAFVALPVRSSKSHFIFLRNGDNFVKACMLFLFLLLLLSFFLYYYLFIYYKYINKFVIVPLFYITSSIYKG